MSNVFPALSFEHLNQRDLNPNFIFMAYIYDFHMKYVIRAMSINILEFLHGRQNLRRIGSHPAAFRS